MQSITEAGTISKPRAGGNMLVQLITPGVGSSGVYPAPVLEAAAADRVFQAGCLMFADHPGEQEAYDRPERSIRDVAGVLVEDARWDGDALVAEVKTFAPWTTVLTEMADSIGVSIRASAEIGEADKATGKPTVARLVEGVSVDFVTRAGRGGAIRQVYEAARSKASLIVRDATNPTGIPVIRTTSEALSGETTSILQQAVDSQVGDTAWVVDFDPDAMQVVYRTQDDDSYETVLYRDGYTITGTAATLDGAPVEVRQSVSYVPVPAELDDTGAMADTAAGPLAESGPTHVPAPAGRTRIHPPTSTGGHMGTIQVDEAEHRRVTEAAGRATAAEAATVLAQRELAVYKAREAVRPVVAAKVAESGLPPRRQAKIVEAVLTGATLDDQGRIDATAVVSATEAEVLDARTDIAELAEALGAGTVRGFGGGTTPEATQVTEADAAAAVAKAFGRTPATISKEV